MRNFLTINKCCAIKALAVPSVHSKSFYKRILLTFSMWDAQQTHCLKSWRQNTLTSKRIGKVRPIIWSFSVALTSKDQQFSFYFQALRTETRGVRHGLSRLGSIPEHFTRETSRRHLNHMPEPPHLAPFNMEEQLLNAESLPDDQADHSICSKLIG